MNDHPEEIYQLAVLQVPGIGWSLARNLLHQFRSATGIFHAPFDALRTVPGIGMKSAKAIVHFNDFDPLYREMDFMVRENIRLIFLSNPGYPIRLKANPDAPIALFVKGDGPLEHRRMIGVVGTRKNSVEGLELCERLITDLAPHHVVIISGLAYGIDAIAHSTALKHGISTTAVVAHGLDRTYPFRHRKLANDMLHAGGQIISECMSGILPNRENFPKRNRIVAGLVDALIVIQSPVAGGSMITADMAFGYNREVMAFPGSVSDPLFGGNHALIKSNRAHLIESSDDVVRIMNYDLVKSNKAQQTLLLDLRDELIEIVQLLRNHGTMEIDALIRMTGRSPAKMAELMFELEINDHVRSLPGKCYRLK